MLTKFTIELDDAILARAEERFSTAYGYSDQVEDPASSGKGDTAFKPNPETKNAHLRRRVAEYIRGVVKTEEVKAASSVAAKNASDRVDAEVIVTATIAAAEVKP